MSDGARNAMAESLEGGVMPYHRTSLGTPWCNAAAQAVLPVVPHEAVGGAADRELSKERNDKTRRDVLDKVLAYDREHGYKGLKFRTRKSDGVYFNDPKVVSIREGGDANLPLSTFEAAARRMQDTLDEFGLDQVPGMSDQAHRLMYDHLKELRDAVKKQSVQDAERRTIIGMIQQSPRVLRETLQLHEYIDPDILHQCSHAYATTQLQRLLHVSMNAKSETDRCTLLVRRGGDAPVKREITGSVQTLNSVRQICVAIDNAKIDWLRTACSDLIPQWSPVDSPEHETWLEENLGVVRQTIFAFAAMGIPQTCILMDTLRDKGYKDSESLFLKDYSELYSRIVKKPVSEHLLNQASMIGTGPKLCDILYAQPGFIVWVGKNAEFTGAVGTTVHKEVAWLNACKVAKQSLSLIRITTGISPAAAKMHYSNYFKVFPALGRMLLVTDPVGGPMRRAPARAPSHVRPNRAVRGRTHGRILN
jgi:hypothetical protein